MAKTGHQTPKHRFLRSVQGMAQTDRQRKGFYTHCRAWLRRVTKHQSTGFYAQCKAWLGEIDKRQRKGFYAQCGARLKEPRRVLVEKINPFTRTCEGVLKPNEDRLS